MTFISLLPPRMDAPVSFHLVRQAVLDCTYFRRSRWIGDYHRKVGYCLNRLSVTTGSRGHVKWARHISLRRRGRAGGDRLSMEAITRCLIVHPCRCPVRSLACWPPTRIGRKTGAFPGIITIGLRLEGSAFSACQRSITHLWPDSMLDSCATHTGHRICVAMRGIVRIYVSWKPSLSSLFTEVTKIFHINSNYI